MDQATAGRVGNLWIILLAAGGSTRLGTPKQLLRTPRRTLLADALARAARFGARGVIVVIGADALRIRAHVQRNAPGMRCVLSRHWRAGMGASLAAGIRALPREADAALVMLCDQPRVGLRALRRLGAARRPRRAGTIVASRYAGRLGVPAIFPRRAFAALRRLDADQGARALLNAAEPRLPVVAIDMPEAALDIDTPGDATARRPGRLF